MSISKRLGGVSFLVQPNRWGHGIELALVGFEKGCLPVQEVMITDLVLSPAEVDDVIEPLAEMDHEAVVSLMDRLWGLGYRPRDYGGPGELEATRAHLADMQAIVSASLDVRLGAKKGGV